MSFSLSVLNRGGDIVIGGSGALDATGAKTLSDAIQEGCSKEGASIVIDLSTITDLDPAAIRALVDVGDFCREQGIRFALSLTSEGLRVLEEAGYDAELLPLKR